MMQTMQIRLTRELINEIRMLVDLGIYPNVSEAVRDSVRMLVTSKERPQGTIPEARKEEIETIQGKIQAEVKKQFQNPKGTVDYYPEEMETKNLIFDSLRKTAKKFGFKEVEAPAFEAMDILAAKSGEEVKNQIFVLEKKGDEQFGLRFDLTVPITRMFVQKQKQIPKPVKWFGLSRMWRYEKPQAGRLREFYQMSVEMFGSDKPEADAEVINLAINFLIGLGLTKDDFYVRLNNRKLLQGILEDYVDSSNINNVIALVDKKDKISPEEFDKGLEEFGVKNSEKLKDILEIDDVSKINAKGLNENAKKGLEELKEITKFLDKSFIKIDLKVARGLAYYTGTVFEIFDKKGKFRAIAGGGRYDEMVKLFGGEDCPATGFGMGYSTLSLLLKEKGLLPEPKEAVDYFIGIVDDASREKAFEVVSKLRKKYNVDVDLTRRNLGNQFKYADSVKAKNVIVIGPEEIKSGKVKVKNMKTGKQVEKKIEDI
jgi:histidyl-tRNA synthetase